MISSVVLVFHFRCVYPGPRRDGRLWDGAVAVQFLEHATRGRLWCAGMMSDWLGGKGSSNRFRPALRSFIPHSNHAVCSPGRDKRQPKAKRQRQKTGLAIYATTQRATHV